MKNQTDTEKQKPKQKRAEKNISEKIPPVNHLEETIQTTNTRIKEKSRQQNNQDFANLIGSFLFCDLLVTENIKDYNLNFKMRERSITEAYKPIEEWRSFFNNKNQTYERLFNTVKRVLLKFWSIAEIENDKTIDFKKQLIKMCAALTYEGCMEFLNFVENRIFVNETKEVLKLDKQSVNGFATDKFTIKGVNDKTPETLKVLIGFEGDNPNFIEIGIYSYFGVPTKNKIFKVYEFMDYLPFNRLLNPHNDYYHGDFFNCYVPSIKYESPKYYDLETKRMKSSPGTADLEKLFTCFDRHLSILANNDEIKKTWLLKYLAQLIQHPDKKPCLYLIFCSNGGTGKSFLADILTGLNGEFNTTVSQSTEQLNGTFNDITVNKTLVIFEEVDNIKRIENTVKAISGATGRIKTNSKGKAPKDTRVYCRLLFFTNYETTYAPDLFDRRGVYFFCDLNKSDTADFYKEYSRLYYKNKNEFIDYLREFLTYCVDISLFDYMNLPPFMAQTKKLNILENPTDVRGCIASATYDFLTWYEGIIEAVKRNEKVNDHDYEIFLNIKNEIDFIHSNECIRKRLLPSESFLLFQLFEFIKSKISNWIKEIITPDKLTWQFGAFFQTKKKGSPFYKGTGKTYSIPYIKEINEFLNKKLTQ